MEQDLNLVIRGKLRLDMPSRRQVIYVPWDMPTEEMREKFGKLVDMGLVKRAVPNARQLPKIEPEGGGGPPPPSKKIYNSPPGAVGLAVEISATENDNKVSQGLAGPCRIIGVELWKFGNQTPYPTWRAGVHVSKSKSVGPFNGDISLFSIDGETTNEGFSPGPHTILVVPYESATGGSFYGQKWNFPFDQVIPYESFYINFSVQSPVAGGVFFCSVHFGGVEYVPGESLEVQNIQPRMTFGAQTYYIIDRGGKEPSGQVAFKPEPVPAAQPAQAARPARPARVEEPKPVKTQFEKRFKNYAAIKTYEAAGNKIVWATLRNTGEGYWGYPLAVTVVGTP